jgi:hypothetical protein
MVAIAKLRVLGPLALIFALPFTNACAAPQEEEEEVGDGTAAALSSANQEFDDIIGQVEDLKNRCANEGRCEGTTTDTAVGTATFDTNIRPQAWPTRSSLRGLKLCDVLRPLAVFESPYFFAGLSAKAAVIKTAADIGTDLVFDLRNQQAALFHYHNHGYQNLVGAEAAGYLGYGFGKKNNVLDAWSGKFETAEATQEVAPFLGFIGVDVGGFIFRSPDNSLWGGAAEVSVGVNALGPLGSTEVSVSEGEWTPWDAATKAFGKSLWFVGYDVKTAPVEGKNHAYLQFRGTKDLALALVERLGPLGILPAAQATALAALSKQKLTISRACPTR